MRARMHVLACLSTVVLSSAAHGLPAQLNLLTELDSTFPPGCLSIDLPDAPRPGQRLLVSENVRAPTLHSATPNAVVNVRVWRVACTDEGYSVVLVRLQVAGDAPVLVPLVLAGISNFAIPDHEARLLGLPGAGASGTLITSTGNTWVLAVDPVSTDGSGLFLPEDYNDEFTLALTWFPYSTDPSNRFFRIAGFDPNDDLPQFDRPVLNGRYSGQWVLAGAPRQGLVLQVAERAERNYVFAILFTYLEGRPLWLAGNTAPALAEPGPVVIPMAALENGAFIAHPNQPLPGEVQSVSAGSIEIEAVDCNRIRVNYDFAPLSAGAGSVELERLVRIAGYDCNPWR